MLVQEYSMWCHLFVIGWETVCYDHICLPDLIDFMLYMQSEMAEIK